MLSSIHNTDSAPPAQATERPSSPIEFELSPPPFDSEDERVVNEAAPAECTEPHKTTKDKAVTSMAFAVHLNTK